jgi:hypothetical protein
MRPMIKSLTCAALALLLVQTTACVSFQPVSNDVLTTEPTGLEPGTRYRFIMRDGREETLYFDWANASTIVGHPKKNHWERRSLERAEIWGIDEQVDKVTEDKIGIAVIGTVAGGWLLYEGLKIAAAEVGEEFRCQFPTAPNCRRQP